MTFSPELEAKIAKLLASFPEGRQQAALIPMLMWTQDEVGHVSKEVTDEVARRCGVTPLQVEEVVGYYTMLRRKPMGKTRVQICTNIACMLVGGTELYEHACSKLGITSGGTTPDHSFSLEEVECIGACSWAPAIITNYDFHHQVTPEKLDKILADLGKVH